MTEKKSAQSIIQSYRKRQQMGPFVIGGLAVLLVVVGIVILAVWLSGPSAPGLALFASRTPTATLTNTPTPTVPSATPTLTFTPSPSPTITLTPTVSGPFEYTIQEGDICWDIASTYEVDPAVLAAINNWDPGTCPINPGDKIWIPEAGRQLDTPTPVPTNFRGEINYVVQMGDSLATIAYEFLSSVDQIMKRNKITDANKINVGDTLIVPVNIATRVPTRAPTSTRSVPPTLAPTNTQIP